MYAVDGLKAVKLDPAVVATGPAAFTQNGAKHNIAVKKRDKFFISLTDNFITKKDWCKAATNGFMNKNLFKDKFLKTKKFYIIAGVSVAIHITNLVPENKLYSGFPRGSPPAWERNQM